MNKLIINHETLEESFTETKKQLEIVYESLRLLNSEYPDFDKWFYQKVVKGIKEGDRSIIANFCDNELAAISILKSNDLENKICTFRVIEKFRGKGIGLNLMKDSFKVLNTTAPLITISEKRLHQFSKLLEVFNFNLHEVYDSYYLNGVKEYSFNGPLKGSELLSSSFKNAPSPSLALICNSSITY
jgi:predicted acetyltransferase